MIVITETEKRKDISKCDLVKSNLQKFPAWELLKNPPKSFVDFTDYILELQVDENDLEEMLQGLFEYIDPKSKILLDQVISKIYSHLKKTIGKKTLKSLANHKIEENEKVDNFEDSDDSNYNQIKEEFYKKNLKRFSLTHKQVQAWCEDYLSKLITERIEIVDNILKFDITGEKNNRILLYLFLLGSYNKNLMVIILYRGDRSSGKSYTIKFVLKLFPKYDQVLANTMTDQSIKYDKSFKNRKMFLLRELFEDQKKLIEYIKAFWDNKEIIHKFVEKVGDSHETRTKIQERLSIVLTFSFENIQADLIDRSIVMNPDQSFSQTEAIFKKDIEKDSNSIIRLFKKEENKKLRFLIGETVNYIDWSWNDVRIVFSDKYLRQMFPEKIPRKARRDKDKIKNLIKIITIWNYKHRKHLTIGNKKIIWSEYEDLKIALQYFEELFHDVILDIDKAKRFILNHMNREDQYEITPIHKYLLSKGADFGRETTKRKLIDLVEKSYLDSKKKKNGRWIYWKIREFDIFKSLNLNEKDITMLVENDYKYYKELTLNEIFEEANNYIENDLPEPTSQKESNSIELLIKSINLALKITNPAGINWLYESIGAKEKGFSFEEFKNIISENPNLTVKRYKDDLQYVNKKEKEEKDEEFEEEEEGTF